MRAKSKSQSKWAFICGGAVGTLIAFPLAAPVFEATIPDPVATAWGSALGAIAAVAGAYWVAGWQVSQQRRNGAALVHALLYPVTVALDELTARHGRPSRAERGESDVEPDTLSADDWQAIANEATRVSDLYNIFKSRIHRYEAALNLLSASSLHVALDLETELEEIVRDPVMRLKMTPQIYNPGTTEVTFPAVAPSWSRRYALNEGNLRVRAYMAVLEQDAF